MNPLTRTLAESHTVGTEFQARRVQCFARLTLILVTNFNYASQITHAVSVERVKADGMLLRASKRTDARGNRSKLMINHYLIVRRL